MTIISSLMCSKLQYGQTMEYIHVHSVCTLYMPSAWTVLIHAYVYTPWHCVPLSRWLNEFEDVNCLCATGGGQIEIIRTEWQAVDVNEPRRTEGGKEREGEEERGKGERKEGEGEGRGMEAEKSGHYNNWPLHSSSKLENLIPTWNAENPNHSPLARDTELYTHIIQMYVLYCIHMSHLMRIIVQCIIIYILYTDADTVFSQWLRLWPACCQSCWRRWLPEVIRGQE